MVLLLPCRIPRICAVEAVKDHSPERIHINSSRNSYPTSRRAHGDRPTQLTGGGGVIPVKSVSDDFHIKPLSTFVVKCESLVRVCLRESRIETREDDGNGKRVMQRGSFCQAKNGVVSICKEKKKSM